MKRFYILFLLTLSCFFAFPHSIIAQNIPDEGEEIEVFVDDHSTVNGPGRAPALIPLTASYYAALSYVEIGFLFNVGCVTITLTNLATGNYSNAMVDSQYGSALIPVTGGSGPYKIEFTIGDGSSFVGFFSVV